MAKAKKTTIDFDDEDAVRDEMAHELDLDPDNLKIKDVSQHRLTGGGTLYEITIKGGKHGKEWCVVENDDQEREMALEIVKQDLEHEPEIFNQNFIESHIDTERLRRDLHGDVLNMRIEDLTDEASRRPDRFWDAYDRMGLESPEEDEDGNRPEPTPEEVEELAELQTDEQLKDPMSYLEDIYGKEDAVAQAIKIAGIDIDAAAEEAVDTDGPAHFLSSYDGKSYTTKSGLVYWRAN